MINLLKVDFYRMFKSKTTIVALIVTILVPFFLIGIIALVALASGDSSVSFAENCQSICGDAGMFSMLVQLNYSPYGYNGIVLVVFGALFAAVDINSGSLRNKVIRGYKRSSIFLSQLIVSMTYYVVLITVSNLVLDLGALAVFQFNVFEYFDVEYVLLTFVNGIFTYLMISSLQIWFLMGLKNTALSIIIPIAVGLVCYMIASLMPTVLLLSENADTYKYLLDAIPTYTLKLPGNVVLGTGSYEPWEVWITIGSCAAFTALNTSLGLLLFTKKDIK